MAPAWAERESVKPEDNYWWRAEDATGLLTIHSLFLFDEPLDYQELRDWFDERTNKFRRFRDRVVVPQRGIGLPHWEQYAEFNIDEHLHRLDLGVRLERPLLEEVISGFLSTPLDYSKPPWEAYLVEGDGSNCALITRVHHIMGDGIALVQLLLDMSATDAALPAPAATQEQDDGWNLPIPGRRTLKRATSILKTGARLVAHPRRALTGSIDVAAEWAWNLACEPDPYTCLKDEPGIAKRAAGAAPIALADVEAIGRARGATVNDVMMTVLTGALRRYLEEHGQELNGQEIRALLPFNVRPKESTPTLDNYFGMVAVSLPIHITNRDARLDEMRKRMAELKHSAAPSANYVFLSAMGLGPKALQDAMTEIVLRRLSVMLTNVPGPRDPVYIAGKRVSDLAFWVPGAGMQGVAVSVLSYAGKLNVTFSTDVHRVPDPEAIARAFEDEYNAFCA